MGQIVSIAREHGVKSYLTVNTVIYDEEIETLHATIDRACEVGVDAIIATDMAAIQYARSVGMDVHISTQSNISNIEAVRFFAQWADVVVLAGNWTWCRSPTSAGRSNGSGSRAPAESWCGSKCSPTAPSAWPYRANATCRSTPATDFRPTGEPAGRSAVANTWLRTPKRAKHSTSRATTSSPKDLCTIDFLDYFIESGVRVLKIEGRARGAEYVKRVVECYDRALRPWKTATTRRNWPPH